MCGVVGVYGVDDSLDISNKLMLGLDHRGQQGAGLVLAGKDGSVVYKRSAARYPISDLTMKMEHMNVDRNNFFAGIGHLRYGTCGGRRSIDNTPPLHCKTAWGEIYVSYNGDTPNFAEIRGELLRQGRIFSTDSDTELILHYIRLSRSHDPIQAIKEGLRSYKGAYALTMLVKCGNEFKLVAARDPHGIRPLSLGRLNNGYIVASENSAFETVGAEFLREINNNELLVISDDKLEVHHIDPFIVIDETAQKLWHCIFELVYFSFPTSTIFGIPVDLFREELGRRAARQFGHLIANDDILTNPPDSSNFFAGGFCKELNRQLEKVFVKRHNTVRSFTQETDETRDEAIRMKFSILRRLIEGKRVWINEDSVVRGRTAKKLVRSLRANGATWVGVISGFPPPIGPCQKGIDMNDLIAAKYLVNGRPAVEDIRKEIEADFLGYITFGDLIETISALGQDPNNFCYGCLKGTEPVWNAW